MCTFWTPRANRQGEYANWLGSGGEKSADPLTDRAATVPLPPRFPFPITLQSLEVKMSFSLKVVRNVGSALCAAALLMAPAAYGQTLAACGQAVPYKVEPPAAQVPPEMRAFSGPWIGTWDSGVCNAIVIESIQPDGTVRILDVFGPVGSKPPGQLRYAGKIAGNTLTSSGGTQAVQYTLNSPTNLSGTFISNTAQSRGIFSRP
jgi:hypothetical protein